VATHLQLRTMHGSSVDPCMAIDNIVVSDTNGLNPIVLPRAFSRYDIPFGDFNIPTADDIRRFDTLKEVSENLPPFSSCSIDILIGANCPFALEPLQVVSDPSCPLIAVRLRHGWTILGSTGSNPIGSLSNFRIVAHEQHSEIFSPPLIKTLYDSEFSDSVSHDALAHSKQDKEFLHIVQREKRFDHGHHVLPLPFKDPVVSMPNNRAAAFKRLMWQREKMRKDEQYYADYAKFIQKLIDKGYCERAPDASLVPCGRIWYLPHHGVYNINKPGKIRVVFDCSARFNGVCINDCLLQGPDLMNSLFSVLTRFREHPIALVADLEAMFYQVRVPPSDRSFLRFLWFAEGDLSGEIVEYQMCVHIFGAISSPSIANFVVHEIGASSIHPEVTSTLMDNFYMDDCLKSTPSPSLAVSLIGQMREEFASNGFHLTQFLSNDRDVITTVPVDDRASSLQLEVSEIDHFPSTRALGVRWNVENDTFGFKTNIREHSLTRRGMLSVSSSLFDPLGMIGPAAIRGKKLLQDACRLAVGWDDPLPASIVTEWHRWLDALRALDTLQVPRCFIRPRCDLVHRELHIFSDASAIAYGSVIYLRCIYADGSVSVSFVVGKCRLAPMKIVSIPRLELTAAVLSTRLYVQVTSAFKATLPVISSAI